METYLVLKDLAIIVIFAKTFGIIARKCKAPQVVGEIIAGLLIGPSLLGIVQLSDFLGQMAEIGVVLLMFGAGLVTNLRDLIKTGFKATLIACAGVFVPLAGGTLLYAGFYGFAAVGSDDFYSALFTGVILTATSVSITVETLREMGKLKGIIGTTIMSAAIIDDVIGIIVLTIVMGMKDASQSAGVVVVNTVLFFLLSIVIGFVIFKIFTKFDARYPHTRRIPIFGLALCFAMAYIAERFFGIADITGAYVAGIILCSIQDHDYIARKMDINSYMLFGPVFFASIGLRTDISEMDFSIVLFAIAFVVVGMGCKVVGCSLAARGCGFKWSDSFKIGVGMMTRGEVALIVSQKGLSVGLMNPVYFTAVILLIITSSILTPIILKLLYTRSPEVS